MSDAVKTYGLLAIKAILAVAFIAAGVTKLAGVEATVATFEAVGMGQWLRYVTGAIELGAGILLWVKGLQFYGAMILLGTMAGAVLTHIFLIGPSMVPALVLGALAAVAAWAHRDQSPLA